MGRAELGQVIDREGLDTSDGSWGRVSVGVPAAWVHEGMHIEITVPDRVVCARCEGGGCDSCARSGAHRTPVEPAARKLQIRLPGGLPERMTLRLVRPFGEHAPLDQLFIAVRADSAASPGVRRIAPPPADALARPSTAGVRALGAQLSTPVVLAALAAVATIVGLLLGR
ncbi:hypothetical protein [Sorangium sp. So ce131]|uniref:hypothetical protein n=1 Tax=Sorangium sp. So ce131 TaxID=3133282 RepID=UPI003F5D8345